MNFPNVNLEVGPTIDPTNSLLGNMLWEVKIYVSKDVFTNRDVLRCLCHLQIRVREERERERRGVQH